jgi:hypothetical protein
MGQIIENIMSIRYFRFEQWHLPGNISYRKQVRALFRIFKQNNLEK